jgi:hypothetical protein
MIGAGMISDGFRQFDNRCEWEGEPCEAFGSHSVGSSLLAGVRGKWYCAGHVKMIAAHVPAPPPVAPPVKEWRHHCHAEGCALEVPPELLMCAPHWRLVPRELKEAVRAAYRPGQCDDKRPSREWLEAAKAAIAAVAALAPPDLSPRERPGSGFFSQGRLF